MVRITLNQAIEIPQYMIEELVRADISNQIQENQLTMSVSLNDLIIMTGVIKSTLEKVFVTLEETKSIEYKIEEKKKRIWLYPEVKDVWIDFLKRIN